MCALSACLFGCGESSGKPRPTIAPVSGKVTYKGQPVVDAAVTFINASSPRTAVGVTNAQGEFALTTFDTNDGALVGEHKVTIAKRQGAATAELRSPLEQAAQSGGNMEAYRQAMTQDRKDVKVENQLPGKYSSPDTSGLVRQVVEGEENKFTFDLTE